MCVFKAITVNRYYEAADVQAILFYCYEVDLGAIEFQWPWIIELLTYTYTC